MTSLGMPAVPPPTSHPTWKQAWDAALYGADGFFRRESPAAHFRTSVHASPLFAAALVRMARRGRAGHRRRHRRRPRRAARRAARAGPGPGPARRRGRRPAGRAARRDRVDHGAAGVGRGPGGRQRVAGQHPLPRRRGRRRRACCGWCTSTRRPATESLGRPLDHAHGADVARALAATGGGRSTSGSPAPAPRWAPPATRPGPTWSAGSPGASRSPSTTATPGDDRPPFGSLRSYRDGHEVDVLPDGSRDVTAHVAVDAVAADRAASCAGSGTRCATSASTAADPTWRWRRATRPATCGRWRGRPRPPS